MHLKTVGLSGDCFDNSFHRCGRFGGSLCWIFSESFQEGILRARFLVGSCTAFNMY